MQLNIRLAYHKTGRARFLSHLDTMRVFQQALRRAGLPLRYTVGFHPHVVLSIALPLSVGIESVTERLDFGVTENGGVLPAKINGVLPEGFYVTRAVLGGRPVSQIAFAVYEMTADSQAAPEDAARLFTSSAVVGKRNKKKEYVPTDIVPFIRAVTPLERGRYRFTLTAQNPVINPEYLAEAWRTYLDPEAAFTFKRAALLDGEGNPFDNLL